MEPAPAWLSYLAPVLAIISIFVSVASYRRSGPRVKVQAIPPINWKASNSTLPITVFARNSGLAPIQIVGVRAQIRFFAATSMTPAINLGEELVTGKATPLTLTNGHQEEWIFNLLPAFHDSFSLQGILSHFGSLGITRDSSRARIFFVASKYALNGLGIALRRGVIPGLYVIIDLGNGVQVQSKPMPGIAYKLLRQLFAKLSDDNIDK